MDRRVVEVAREAMARRRLPGLLIAVDHRGGTELWHEGVDATGAPLTGETLLPVASLTKLATALAVLRLVDDDLVRPDDRLSLHLPGAAAARLGVTVRRLLAHTAGLPHDVGPATATEQYNSAAWRSLALPWSGLIADPRGALTLARAFQDAFLQAATGLAAVADQSEGLSGGLIGTLEWSPCPWGLGPELRGTKGPRHWAPATASPGSWGHAGASGCIAWCDPAADVAWFLAGTRTTRSGWLLDAGPRVGAALLEAYGRPT